MPAGNDVADHAVKAIWQADGKAIKNITEYIAQFCLGLVQVKQEFMESSVLIWQRNSAHKLVVIMGLKC